MFGSSFESGSPERYQNLFKPPAPAAGPGTAVAPGRVATPPGRNIVVNGGTVRIVNPPENSNIIINGGNVTIINPLDIGGTRPRPGIPPTIPAKSSGGSSGSNPALVLPMPEIQPREKPISLQPYSSMSTIKCHQPSNQPKRYDLLESYAPGSR